MPCPKCPAHSLPGISLLPIPSKSLVSHSIVDIVTDLTTSQGHTVTLTIIDRFFRFIPLPELPAAFLHHRTSIWACFPSFHYGIPEDIVIDCGPQFTSQVWASFIEKLGASVSLSSRYHLQTNGQVESANQEVGRFLWVYCTKNQCDCSKFLPWAEYEQNSLRHSATKLLGYQPPRIHGTPLPTKPQPWTSGSGIANRCGNRPISILKKPPSTPSC